MDKDPTVYIGIPSHNGQVHGDIMHAIFAAAHTNQIKFQHAAMSLLARNFNDFLCEAINDKRFTHFVLLHADIIPVEPDWLKKMIAIMAETKVEILSAVIPIKTPKGLTSTGLAVKEAMPMKMKRFTLKEVHAMPETFTHEHLVVNSGLLLIDLQAPWVGKVWFEIKDDVIQQEDGKYKSFGISEDWLFSLRARELGAKIAATRAVKALHIGQNAFANYEQFGIESEDWRY